ncbi:hypothetical protein MYP_3337 [Sporocytophaga myxococcoides]|uniref:Uncharacterized protein n=2 Tax=Sporocytophaga myxococcoides TaxID=153721 RepID=A0A098LIW2_9BACT|nr:hypothetical protein MYP_3337 [Sporocytophaga myxococcoides]
MPMDSTGHKEHDTIADHQMDHKETPMDSMMMHMPSALSRNLPMNVNGSGTSWQPRNTPMYMIKFHKNDWNFMLHYGIFFTYSNQNINRAPGQRGDASISAPNWVMLMANRLVGKRGLFMVRAMFSGDPFTVGGQGYPLLFQSGESWKGKPLIDHQHPHDLISELSVAYSLAFNKNIDLYAYLGYPGEPAIGPPAFMHRPSSLNMPAAPLSHHWQDATHIIFGVATVGFRYKIIKIEGSTFTGKEPNENRYNFDKPRFDSYSSRISLIPGRSLALQASYGYLKSPEVLFPEENLERYTASVLHNYWFNDEKVISTSLTWGMNKYQDEGKTSYGNSVVLESNLQIKHWSYFTRMEFVQKDNHELEIESEEEHQSNNIGALALGMSRYISKNKYFWLDLGAIGTVYAFSNDLNPYYGNNPWSFQIFLRIIPPRMKMMGM